MRIVAVETASLSERKDIAEGRAHLANLIGDFVFEPIDIVATSASAVGSWTRAGEHLVKIINRISFVVHVSYRRRLEFLG